MRDYHRKRVWCLTCGEPVGNCIHKDDITKDPETAFRVWIKCQTEIAKSLTKLRSKK